MTSGLVLRPSNRKYLLYLTSVQYCWQTIVLAILFGLIGSMFVPYMTKKASCKYIISLCRFFFSIFSANEAIYVFYKIKSLPIAAGRIWTRCDILFFLSQIENMVPHPFPEYLFLVISVQHTALI